MYPPSCFLVHPYIGRHYRVSLISVLTLERNHTRVRNVIRALLSLHISGPISVLSIQLIKLKYTSALIVHTLPNIVRQICGIISLLTLERNHTRVRNVIRALLGLHISALICVLSIQLIKLRYTSVLIVHTLPNIVLQLCGIISLLTLLERSHTRVRNVGSASPRAQIVIDIRGESIELINSSLSIMYINYFS